MTYNEGARTKALKISSTAMRNMLRRPGAAVLPSTPPVHRAGCHKTGRPLFLSLGPCSSVEVLLKGRACEIESSRVLPERTD